jgi:RNA polymerase sigma-70 factor (ECF subfamily)
MGTSYTLRAGLSARIVWPQVVGSRRALARESTRGDEAEFTALVQRQSRFVYRVAYAVLVNSHDAEDAVQETFLKLYRNGGWRDMQNERAFIARTAWRVAVDRLPRASQPAPSPELFDSADAMPSLEPGPEREAISADQHALIHALIDKLPEELRVPLVLSSFDELNSREIGVVLGVPEGTVRTRLQRARLMLREKLTKVTARNNEARYV